MCAILDGVLLALLPVGSTTNSTPTQLNPDSTQLQQNFNLTSSQPQPQHQLSLTSTSCSNQPQLQSQPQLNMAVT